MIYLRSRYHQLRIRVAYILKNAFRTRYCDYEIIVMSFRLTNAPTSFIYFMTHVFRTYLYSFIISSLIRF